MSKYIFERYLLAKVYFSKFKDCYAFKLNICICQKVPFIFRLTHMSNNKTHVVNMICSKNEIPIYNKIII